MLPPEKSKAALRDEALAALIAKLGDHDASVRERAAGGISSRGRERAAKCVRDWLGDAELAKCFVREDEASGATFPRMTVGIAVHPSTFERIRSANGTPRLANVPPDLDAREFELHFAEGVRLDVLTTREDRGEGAIARFLRKFGEGIQQVELDVRDVKRATELLRSRFGVAAIYAEARRGADGTLVNFFLVADGKGGKLLVELVESPTAR